MTSPAEKNINPEIPFIKSKIANPLWLSVSEAAKLGGVTNKTIRRAIQSKFVAYKIIKDRYQVELISVLNFLHSNRKLTNKLKQKGLGQYVKTWID